MALGRPPMPPPEVTGQMGMPPSAPPPEAAGMTSVQAGPQPGAVDPNGELVAQVEAVKRVLEQIVRLNPVMAPFAQKSISILDTGLSAVSTTPPEQSPAGGIEAMMAQKSGPPMG